MIVFLVLKILIDSLKNFHQFKLINCNTFSESKKEHWDFFFPHELSIYKKKKKWLMKYIIIFPLNRSF